MIVFAFLAAGALAFKPQDATLKRPRLWIPALVLTLFIGLRREVGPDWWSYVQILRYTNMTGPRFSFAHLEPGFSLVNSAASMFGWGVWFPNLVCATIFTWGLIAFARRQPNPWLALTVAVPYLIIGVAMGATRQSAAIGLVMLALVDYLDGRTWRAIAIAAVAPFFHVSALVVIPMLLLAQSKQNVAAAILLLFISLILASRFESWIELRLSYYVTGTVTSTGAVPRIAMNVVPAAAFMLFRGRLAETLRERRLWTIWSIAAFACVPSLLLIRSSTVIDRFAIYLVPLQMAVFSRMPTAFSISRKHNFFLLTVAITYSLAAEVVWLSTGKMASRWIPYNNYIWDRSPSPMVPSRARAV